MSRISIDNYYVYKHTCPNGKVYVGITNTNPILRWNKGKGYKHNEHFYNAILKYGWDNIKHEILYTDLTKEEACKKEIELIAEYKSNQREFGYNVENGGNSCGKVSEETRKKMSEAKKNYVPWNKGKPSPYKGVPRPNSVKAKIALANGKPVLQFDMSENFIREFNTIIEAQRLTGINNISLCCRGKIRQSGGYIWRYKNESNQY